MKNNNLFKKIISLFILFFVLSSGYAQLSFNHATQQSKLQTAASNLSTYFSLNSNVTVAITQLPNANVFLIAQNTQTVNSCFRSSPEEVIIELLNQGFPAQFSGDYMRIIFVSGVSTDAAPSTMRSNYNGIDYSKFEYYSLGLPAKNQYQNITRTVEKINVHAEMNIMAALGKLYTDPSTDFDDIVIMSNRPFCPRCRAYLNYNNFYVGALSQIASPTNQKWCVPNYNSSDTRGVNTYPWPAWLRKYSLNYLSEANSNGISNATGQNIAGPSYRPVTIDIRWQNQPNNSCTNL